MQRQRHTAAKGDRIAFGTKAQARKLSKSPRAKRGCYVERDSAGRLAWRRPDGIGSCFEGYVRAKWAADELDLPYYRMPRWTVAQRRNALRNLRRALVRSGVPSKAFKLKSRLSA